MLSWLRRYRRSIFIGTITIFLLGIFVGLGGYYFTGKDNSESVAVVGNSKIPYSIYQARVNQYLDSVRAGLKDKELTDEMAREIRQGMLRDMIVDEILYQQAKALGLEVTEMELAFSIRNTPQFQRDGNFDQALYFQTIRRALRTTPEEYERQQRKSILGAKFKQLIFNSAKLAPSEIREEYVRENKGDKDFDKKGLEFAQALQQRRALEIINFYLKQLSSQIEIRSFLEQREQGV